MVPYVSLVPKPDSAYLLFQAIKTTDYEVHFVRPRGSSDCPVSVLARRDSTVHGGDAVWSALREKVRFVIIDNDNLRYSDMVPYVSLAIKTTDYEVHFVRPRGSSDCPVSVLARRNRRGLSEQDLLEMQTNFETFLTVDKFVADLKSQNLPPYPNSSITLDLPPLSSLQSSTTSKSSSNSYPSIMEGLADYAKNDRFNYSL
nr:hypothetical transcript [Hymenolepis microstoma]